jgi:hypothetical protein
MSLREFPLTPTRLEANRRNAGKSTGPRTAYGKSQSRMNGLRSGARPRLHRDLLQALVDALPGAVARTGQAVLTPAQAGNPLFAGWISSINRSASLSPTSKTAPRFRTSFSTTEATKYMKKKHSRCRTNCPCRTLPYDRCRRCRRLRCELGSRTAPVACGFSEEAR